MAKRDVVRRIDYDPLPRQTIIRQNTEAASDLTLEEVQAMIDAQVDIRYIDVPPTDFFFRKIEGPTIGSTHTMHIPSDAQVGDLLYFTSATSYYTSYIVGTGLVGGAYLSGPASWGSGVFVRDSYLNEPWDPAREPIPEPRGYGICSSAALYAITAGDIGGSVTYTVTGDRILDSTIGFSVLLKQEKFWHVAPAESNFSTGYRIQSDFLGIHAAPSADALTLFNGSELAYGYSKAQPAQLISVATPLCEVWSGNTHLTVGYWVRPSTITSASWDTYASFQEVYGLDVLRKQ